MGEKRHFDVHKEKQVIFGFTIPFKDNKKGIFIYSKGKFKDFQPWKFPRFALTVGTL